MLSKIINNYWEKTLKIIIIITLGAIMAFMTAQYTDLTNSDLGRHLKNGETIISNIFSEDFQSDVFSKNFYSYTYPDFSFPNHHWGFGAILYTIFKIFSFSGLTLLLVIIKIAAFFVFFWIAAKKSNFYIATLASLFLLPLVLYRREIRPEQFSYLFAGVYFVLLYLFQLQKISPKKLYISLIALQILWVNIHIYSVFGPLIIAIFIFCEIINTKEKSKIKTFLYAFAITILASFINPNFLDISSYFLIFQNYGYSIFENQSIPFLENLGYTNPVFGLFKIACIFGATLLAIAIVIIITKNPRRAFDPVFIITAIFGFMAYSAVRDITIFGLFAIISLAKILYIIIEKSETKINVNKIIKNLSFAAIAILIIFFHIHSAPKMAAQARQISGLGLYKNNTDSILFFKKNNLTGPIFNNYDIGGFLIYGLFPQERVFVDNRPESYPTSFFQNTYIPMQEDEDLWKRMDDLYNFNCIFFQRQDMTPWAQPFLIKRLQDKNWTPVFVDDFTIIFLKNNEDNKKIIEKYKIPDEYFSVTKI